MSTVYPKSSRNFPPLAPLQLHISEGIRPPKILHFPPLPVTWTMVYILGGHCKGMIIGRCSSSPRSGSERLREGKLLYDALPQEVSLDDAASGITADLQQRLQKAPYEQVSQVLRNPLKVVPKS